MNDFDYLSTSDIYLDSACQSLRPRPVIEALEDYYTKFNSCGERVKYQWGRITDQKVEATREKVLKYLKLNPRHYFVSFTLNTTYGLNLLLSQFDSEKAKIEHIITSDIEHNSPFLSTMSFARKNNIERIVIDRNPDGSINIDDIPEIVEEHLLKGRVVTRLVYDETGDEIPVEFADLFDKSIVPEEEGITKDKLVESCVNILLPFLVFILVLRFR